MRFENMEPDDFMTRGFLLPEGCKDLTDACKVKAPGSSTHESPPPHSPPIEIIIPEQTTVADLATLLHQPKFQIVADLMKLNVFLTISQTPDYETITKVALLHGYIAKRPA